MRKGQRFTPARLVRWHNTGRGTGTGADYQPWHQVTRDDPGSRGRSHLINWRFGRLHHLLSDLELVAFGFASMLPNVLDLREQFPLATQGHDEELGAYEANRARPDLPGTIDIADALGVRHPAVRQADAVEPWVLSTDLLLTLRSRDGRTGLLAIAVKTAEELQSRRKLDLLRIERDYWRIQDVFWLLVTPALFDAAAATAIRIGMLWAIGQPAIEPSLLVACGDLAPDLDGRSSREAFAKISRTLNVDTFDAQHVFWQAVWCGNLPIQLIGFDRPNSLIRVVSPEVFWQQNPIASRRTAWTL